MEKADSTQPNLVKKIWSEPIFNLHPFFITVLFQISNYYLSIRSLKFCTGSSISSFHHVCNLFPIVSIINPCPVELDNLTFILAPVAYYCCVLKKHFRQKKSHELLDLGSMIFRPMQVCQLQVCPIKFANHAK